MLRYKSIVGSYLYLSEHQFSLTYLLCKYAIKEHRIINLYYESGNGNRGWRKVEPYLVGIKDKGRGNVFFTGYFLPTKSQLDEGQKYEQKTYLLDKADTKQFEITDEIFYKLQVPAERIYQTPKIIVLCRVECKY